MLEFMLIRLVEQPLFQGTREWLQADSDNQIIVVLDEAHLYRGAQGAEIAMLMRRLIQHLGVDRTRFRFILTSATLGSQDVAKQIGPQFAADLTGGSTGDFRVITGARQEFLEGGSGSESLATTLAEAQNLRQRETLRQIANAMGWDDTGDESEESVPPYLDANLRRSPPFRRLYNLIAGKPIPLEQVASNVFPDVDHEIALDATIKLIELGSRAQDADGQTLLPVRTHVFFKGLPPQYVCLNPKCPYRRAREGHEEFLGRMYPDPKVACKCGSRVFELLSHRTCGAAYVRAYRRRADRQRSPQFLWTDPEEAAGLDELHLLLESPRDDEKTKDGVPLTEGIQSGYLDMKTGYLFLEKPEGVSERLIRVWLPDPPPEPGWPWTWTRCPACWIRENYRDREGRTRVMDLETKGEEPFANLTNTLFQLQPTDPEKKHLPNQGRKVLCFSDGRQKAARLARDLQRAVERDSFREVAVAALPSLSDSTTLDRLYPAIVVYTAKKRISFFDDSDAALDAEGHGYPGSRTVFVNAQKKAIDDLIDLYELDSADDIPHDKNASEDLNENRPRQYDQAVLRLLGHKYYSIASALVAFAEPCQETLESICKGSRLNQSLVREIVLESIKEALRFAAFDKGITDKDRLESRGWRRPEGLTREEFIPRNVVKNLEGLVSDDELSELAKMFIRCSPRLFIPMRGRYVLNPEVLTLRMALDHRWFRCTGCRMFSAWSLNKRCPACGGRLAQLAKEDPHIEARKSFLRDPSERVWRGERTPLTLRSEEHSAQLSSKDHSEVFSKTEQYELLFQDILPSENEVEQPVDVLSCTTTMEVGIDIGSLTGVAMRTVPPRPENYQQRSGRAGRRGAPLSTIITFADNTPYSTYHFEHPETLIGAAASDPIVYIGNRKICERHINASLLQRFFHRDLGPDGRPKEVQSDVDVFGSLGKAKEFFLGNDRYSMGAFVEWVKDNVLSDGTSSVTNDLGNLLPPELRPVLEYENENWRTQFIQDQAKEFMRQLRSLKSRGNWEIEESPDDDLLSTFLDAGMLPTFSFPIDLCTFAVRQRDSRSYRVTTKYEMQQGLKQALSEYIPGRQLVVDKKTFTSYGLHFPFARDPANRAAGVEWGDLLWINYCDSCESVLEEQARNLEEEQRRCHVCNIGTIRSVRVFTPEGFSPKIDPHSSRAVEGEEEEVRRVYARPAKFPVPLALSRDDTMVVQSLQKATARRLSNQKLLIVNFGPGDDRFQVCKRCGAVGGQDGLPNPHARPYPKDPRARVKWPDRCKGQTIQTTFGYTLRTDLTTIRIAIEAPMSFAIGSDEFKAAKLSLSEALVLGASRVLGIDSTELASGFRDLPPFPDDEKVLGYIEFFLYDTTPGGAGFADRVYQRINDVLKSSLEILRGCTCAHSCQKCLRTYENRIWHGRLDRLLAAELLEYALSGKIPTIADERVEVLATQVEETIRLMKPNLSVEFDADNGIWSISDGTSVTSYRFHCCLIEPEPTDEYLDISDYEVLHRMPSVAYRLTEKYVSGTS